MSHEGNERSRTRFAMHANPDHLQLPGDLPAGSSPPLAVEEHDHADEIVRCRDLLPLVVECIASKSEMLKAG
jgi:hypothetical protein